MKTILIILIALLLAGDILGAYFAFKAFKLRQELIAFQGYLKNSASQATALKSDFGGISVYADDNQTILSSYTAQQRKALTVLFGASITKNWDIAKYLKKENILNRGIGSQSDTQLLTRFASDVLQLEPGQVVIKFCSGNFTAPGDDERMLAEYEMMVMMAVRKGIRPLLATVIPATKNAEKYDNYSISDHVKRFNDKIRQMALDNGLVLVDYYAAMADENDFLKDTLARDDIHPNDNGYQVMADVLNPYL